MNAFFAFSPKPQREFPGGTPYALGDCLNMN